MAVFEIKYKNPVSLPKREFIKSLGVFYAEMHVYPGSTAAREDDNPDDDVMHGYAMSIRDVIRRRLGLPTKPPYVPYEGDFT